MKVPFKLGEYQAELIGSGWFIYNEKGERFSISWFHGDQSSGANRRSWRVAGTGLFGATGRMDLFALRKRNCRAG